MSKNSCAIDRSDSGSLLRDFEVLGAWRFFYELTGPWERYHFGSYNTQPKSLTQGRVEYYAVVEENFGQEDAQYITAKLNS